MTGLNNVLGINLVERNTQDQTSQLHWQIVQLCLHNKSRSNVKVQNPICAFMGSVVALYI